MARFIWTIEVDYEHNAEAWWEAARELAAAKPASVFARLLRELESNDAVKCDDGEARAFEDAASRLPEWNTGPKYAPHPVILTPPEGR